MRKCAGSEAIKALESVPAVQEHISLTCIYGANADNPGVPGLLQQLLRVVVSAGVLLTFLGSFAVIVRGGEWLARTWQTDEGLPDNRVTGVAQSPDGYLWVATHGGLMRFNGAQFEEFSLVHLPGVANRCVRKLYQDRRNRLWLVMDRGEVVRVDDHAARVFTLADGVPASRVTAVAEDEHGNVWLVGGPTVCRIAGDTVSTFTADDGLPPDVRGWWRNAKPTPDPIAWSDARTNDGPPWFWRDCHRLAARKPRGERKDPAPLSIISAASARRPRGVAELGLRPVRWGGRIRAGGPVTVAAALHKARSAPATRLVSDPRQDSEHSIQGLTERKRNILDAAGKRMAKQ